MFSLNGVPHERPRLGTSGTFYKTGLAKCRGGSVKCEYRRHLLLRLDRVALQNFTAVFFHEVNRRSQQLHGHALFAVIFVNEKARRRPHRLIVDPLRDARPLQRRKSFPRRHRAPANRLAIVISQDSGNLAGVHNFFHCPLVAIAFEFIEL